MKDPNYMKTNLNGKQAFEAYLKSKGFTKKSIANRLKTINLYKQWTEKENLEIEQVTYNDLLLFMKYSQQRGRIQKTIHQYLIVVKHFYDHLLESGKITINPATGIEVKGVKRKALYHILEAHELHQLYHAYPADTLHDRRNKVILGLFTYQGLKSEEVGRLEVKDIKLREGKIDVAGGVRSNSRILSLEAHQVMDMYDYVLQVRPELLQIKPNKTYKSAPLKDALFIGEGGYRYSMDNLITKVMTRAKKINPSVQNAKQLRASVITKWLRTKNLRETQYLAGHRYISSTESYLQNEMEGLKEEVQMFHPLG